MKFIKLVILFFVFSYTNLYPQNNINFEKGTWNEVKLKAQQEKKFIFLDCYTSWCKPCKVMEKEVFTNDSVAKFYNDNFINVKYDMEKGIGQALNQKYAITGYPTLLILDYRGLEVHRNFGELTAQKFIDFGKTVLQPATYRAALQRELDKGNVEYDFIISYLENLAVDFSDNTAIIDAYWKNIAKETVANKENWLLLKMYVKSTKTLAYQSIERQEQDFARLYTKDSVEYVKFNVIRREIMEIVFSDSIKPEKFKPLREKFNPLKHPDKEVFLYLIDKDFYRNNQLWEDYFNLIATKVEKIDWSNDKLLIEYAGLAVEKLPTSKYLVLGEKLTLRAIELKADNSFYYDVLAQILLKLNRKQEALNASEKCLALAKTANEDTSLYEETYQKIKQAK